jgi:RNA polymerase sigma-70 factor (ECF subfamily)
MSESSPAAASPTGRTSLSLLARAKVNEVHGWQKIVDLYSPLVFFSCRRSGLGREDAADVLQNVWQAVAV